MHGYKLACVALIQMECSASKERVVARVAHHWRTRIRHAALRLPTKARTTLQRFDLFAPGLQRGRERNGLSSALCKRDAWQERPRCGACLRTRFARFCGKTTPVGFVLSAGCNASTPVYPNTLQRVITKLPHATRGKKAEACRAAERRGFWRGSRRGRTVASPRAV